jgi:SAM-dependent methyltransferase
MEKTEYEIMYKLETSYWWFLGKQFLVEDQFRGLDVDPPKECKILDVGAGTGLNIKTLEKFGNVCGVERSSEAIHFLRKRGVHNVICSDANASLPFRDGVFSAVTCLDVLEHLDRDEFLLKELHRVCKPGGYIFITVPAFRTFWSPHDIALHHKRRYTKEGILGRISNMECRVIKASYYNIMLLIPIVLFRGLKSVFSSVDHSQSDFFLSLPRFLNRSLAALFKAEITLLRYFGYPLGVSLLVILQKKRGKRCEGRS